LSTTVLFDERKPMLRRLLLPLALLAVFFVAATVGNAGTTKSSGLVGEVGPGFSIEVKLNGRDLKTIKAGTYKIKVEDKASTHNFHLIGKGLNKKTGVAFNGDQTWTITLKPGKVTYQCDPHAASGMKGSFKVTG
jgi:plastocyanin